MRVWGTITSQAPVDTLPNPVKDGECRTPSFQWSIWTLVELAYVCYSTIELTLLAVPLMAHRRRTVPSISLEKEGREWL